MKNIPVFTTEYGVASLTLREIPYRGEAYIRIQAASEPEQLLAQCAAFCRSAGAAKVYAAGHACLEALPFHTAIWRMRRETGGLPDTDAALWPVQRENVALWREWYNLRMAGVANAAYFTTDDAERLLAKGDGYFVHRGRTLLGIGRASGGRLDAAASCVPGGGRDTVLALCHAVSDPVIELEVASVNEKAVRLYEKLGFLTVGELSCWFRVEKL